MSFILRLLTLKNSQEQGNNMLKWFLGDDGLSHVGDMSGYGWKRQFGHNIFCHSSGIEDQY